MDTPTAAQLSKEAKLQMSKDPEVSLQLAGKALHLAEMDGDAEAQSEALFVMGVCNHRLGKSVEAVHCFHKRMELVSQTDDPTKISSAHNNLGNALCGISDYGNAIEHFFTALKLFEELGDEQHITSTKINLGIAFQNLNRLDDALQMYKDALAYALKTNDRDLQADSYLNMGVVLTLQQKFDEADKANHKAYELCVLLNEKFKQVEILNNIGANEEVRGMFLTAKATYEKCLVLCREQSLSIYELRSMLNLGSVELKLSNYDRAEKLLIAGLQMAEAKTDKLAIRTACKLLSELYESQGKLREAFDYFKKYVEVKREVLNMQNLQQLGQLQMRYEMDKNAREAEINRLRHVELKRAFDNLQSEKKKSEELLLNILPQEVAEELKEKGYAEARLFENVTVLFTDFVNFTRMSERLSPEELVGELHTCFSTFDEIIDRYGIEKIKTVGDAYLAVSGLPLSNSNHAKDMVSAAIEIRDFIHQRRIKNGDKAFALRIGINSGSVVAGIVGTRKFAYDVWGDTVNIAARMEQSGQAGKVNISEATYQLVKPFFDCRYRGEIVAKNKGEMKMYFVEK